MHVDAEEHSLQELWQGRHELAPRYSPDGQLEGARQVGSGPVAVAEQAKHEEDEPLHPLQSESQALHKGPSMKLLPEHTQSGSDTVQGEGQVHTFPDFCQAPAQTSQSSEKLHDVQ